MHLRRSFGVFALALLASAASVPSAFAQASTSVKASAPVSGSASGVTSAIPPKEDVVLKSVDEVMRRFRTIHFTHDFLDADENVVAQRELQFEITEDGVPLVSVNGIAMVAAAITFEGNTLKVVHMGFGNQPQITTFSVNSERGFENHLIVRTEDFHGSGAMGFSVSPENGAVHAEAACVCFPSDAPCPPTDCAVSMECMIGPREYHCRDKYADASVGNVQFDVVLR